MARRKQRRVKKRVKKSTRKKALKKRVKKSTRKKALKKRVKKSTRKKVRTRRKGRVLIGYTLYWPRRRRTQYQIEQIIMKAPFKKIVKRFKQTNIIKVTYFATYRKKRIARSFIMRYKVLTVSGLEDLLLRLLEEIFAGLYDYSLKDQSAVVWRNYIENIELNFKI